MCQPRCCRAAAAGPNAATLRVADPGAERCWRRGEDPPEPPCASRSAISRASGTTKRGSPGPSAREGGHEMSEARESVSAAELADALREYAEKANASPRARRALA